MKMIQTLKNSFKNKLIEDHRLEKPFFSLNLSVPFLGDKTCSFLLPEFTFYLQLILVSCDSKEVKYVK